MNKKPWIIVTVFALLLACMGQLKISQYPNTKTAPDTDLLLLATPGVTNRNITVADFRSNVIAYGGGNTYYISNAYVTNLYVTTQYVTNLYVTTNYVYQQFVTNNVAISNFFDVTYATNLYVTTNITYYSYVTNLTVFQTNINNYQITTNLTVYETNINNVTIVTNLYVTENSFLSNIYVTNLYSSNIFSTNLYVSNAYFTNITANKLYVSNAYVTNLYVTNLYVDNPVFGLQQLTNVAITNTAAGDVLQWNNTMKLWTNSPPASTNTIYYTSLAVTNIAYQTNTDIDCSLAQNIYWMTNAMANHMYIQLTNMTPPQSVSVVIQGASAATNLSIWVIGNVGNTVNWLSITNGSPTMVISSNQTMMVDFTVISSSTATNVLAAWKETFK